MSFQISIPYAEMLPSWGWCGITCSVILGCVLENSLLGDQFRRAVILQHLVLPEPTFFKEGRKRETNKTKDGCCGSLHAVLLYRLKVFINFFLLLGSVNILTRSSWVVAVAYENLLGLFLFPNFLLGNCILLAPQTLKSIIFDVNRTSICIYIQLYT